MGYGWRAFAYTLVCPRGYIKPNRVPVNQVNGMTDSVGLHNACVVFIAKCGLVMNIVNWLGCLKIARYHTDDCQFIFPVVHSVADNWPAREAGVIVTIQEQFLDVPKL